MAKPRVFISSTYIDLKHARRHIEAFIKTMGYDSVLFESGDIPFYHDIPIDESCYAEIENCHMLVLIIGGKYGSPSSEDILNIKDKAVLYYNSITKKEYEAAKHKNIPVFIFVEKGVLSEYQTFKKNRDNKDVEYAHVDSTNIFKLLDDVISHRVNNYVRGFENFEEITSWLKDQWAGMFADYLSRKNTDTNLFALQSQISELREISNSLKIYNEQLLKTVNPKESETIIRAEDRKIEMKKLKRFATAGLIDFIINELKKEGSEQTLIDIYRQFLDTDNLTEFLRNIGIDELYVQQLSTSMDVTIEYDSLRKSFKDDD